MDKQKEIEEMAEIIFNSRYKNGYISPLKGANALYNAGYRKIPENAVVLTREEYTNYLVEYIGVKEIAERIRKETAEKFAERARQRLDEYRLENEYFTDNEPNGNLWQMNSSIFYLEVIDEGGLIDEIANEITEDEE